MKKILLQTDQKKYYIAMQRYSDYLASKEQIFNIADALGYPIPRETTDFKEAIYEAVAKANVDKNPMGLKAQKLTELLEIPLEGYNEAVKDMEKALETAWTGYKLVSPAWPEPKKPDIEDYRAYAETPAQIERYKAAKNLHKTITAAAVHLKNINKHQVRQAFGNVFEDAPFSGVEKGLLIDPLWVLNG